MGKNRVCIWLSPDDRDLLRNEIKSQFLIKYPEYDGKISDNFLIHKLIQFWMGELK